MHDVKDLQKSAIIQSTLSGRIVTPVSVRRQSSGVAGIDARVVCASSPVLVLAKMRAP
jgi:hypothetical protein